MDNKLSTKESSGADLLQQIEPRYLNPEQVRVHRNEDNRVYVTIDDNLTVIDARLLRVYPLTDPDLYLAIVGPDPNGRNFGLLRNWRKVDSDSRRIVEEELARRYLHPVIKRICSMEDYFGSIIAVLETDRGMREVTFRDIRDNAIYHSDGRILLTDAEGNRYDIPDFMNLDATSRVLLDRML